MKATLAPEAFVSFRVINAARSPSTNAESSKFLTASLKVRVIVELIATSVAELAGKKTTVGAVTSATILVAFT